MNTIMPNYGAYPKMPKKTQETQEPRFGMFAMRAPVVTGPGTGTFTPRSENFIRANKERLNAADLTQKLMNLRYYNGESQHYSVDEVRQERNRQNQADTLSFSHHYTPMTPSTSTQTPIYPPFAPLHTYSSEPAYDFRAPHPGIQRHYDVPEQTGLNPFASQHSHSQWGTPGVSGRDWLSSAAKPEILDPDVLAGLGQQGYFSQPQHLSGITPEDSRSKLSSSTYDPTASEQTYVNTNASSSYQGPSASEASGSTQKGPISDARITTKKNKEKLQRELARLSNQTLNGRRPSLENLLQTRIIPWAQGRKLNFLHPRVQDQAYTA